MGSTAKKVREAAFILGGLGLIGFLGLIWLMIYGNLSGNLGFTLDSGFFINETVVINSTGVTPPNMTSRLRPTITVVRVENGSSTVDPANYMTVGAMLFVVTSPYNNTAVNVTYDATFAGTSEEIAEGTVANITEGFGTFYGFSTTFFTIAAIVLLIFMLMGLLAIASKIMGGRKKSGFAES